MDFKEIKGVKHYIYTFDESPPNILIIDNWRDGKKGDWVRTDDEHVCQILHRGTLTKPTSKHSVDYIRTIAGSYECRKDVCMNSEIPENIYTFSKTYNYQQYKNKDNLSSKEFLFAKYVSKGDGVADAYLKAFPTNDRKYAEFKGKLLLQTKRIQHMITEEIQDALKEEKVTYRYLIRAAKAVIEGAEKDNDRMRSVEFLAKVNGMINPDNKKESLTIYQGITNEQLESIKRGHSPKLIAHGEKES